MVVLLLTLVIMSNLCGVLTFKCLTYLTITVLSLCHFVVRNIAFFVVIPITYYALPAIYSDWHPLTRDLQRFKHPTCTIS